jgi:hypothetical protein
MSRISHWCHLRITAALPAGCPQALKTAFFGLKCGLWHSTPAVVGRKSGLSKMADDDSSTSTAQQALEKQKASQQRLAFISGYRRKVCSGWLI